MDSFIVIKLDVKMQGYAGGVDVESRQAREKPMHSLQRLGLYTLGYVRFTIVAVTCVVWVELC